MSLPALTELNFIRQIPFAERRHPFQFEHGIVLTSVANFADAGSWQVPQAHQTLSSGIIDSSMRWESVQSIDAAKMEYACSVKQGRYQSGEGRDVVRQLNQAISVFRNPIQINLR
ncbi:MAG: hypothetical protein KDK27_00570 [Leptospiraceae bacterium]|nr:hypothetical protein [Leptospiraceae bacterium]